jgi:predicted phosphodiesterase
MKLHILSDIHLEFQEFDPPDVGADVIILAGDIHIKKRHILGVGGFPKSAHTVCIG